MTEPRQKTVFHQWMIDCGFNDAAAAVRLGLSANMVKCLREGIKPNGGPCLPQRDTRLLMTVIAEGWRPKAWPV